MRLPWQKVSAEEIEKTFADKTKPGPYDNQYVVLKDINKVYSNTFHAVYDFNLTIQKQEFVVFVGPSGCGKSTTLRMIAGLEDISSGELYINGEYANDLLAKDRDIAMVFQNYALYPNMTVFNNMAYALKVRHFPKNIIKERVEQAAKTLEIEDQLQKKPKELSGGQRQRVALGRSIVRNARIFLMDEPLSNLDAKLRVQMRSEIIRLHKKLKATTIYVTHDQTEAMTMADRIVVMKLGVVQQIGTPKDIYRNPANLFVASFIGSPAMNIIRGSYNKGVIEFPNGDKLTLDEKQSKALELYYRENYVKESRELPELEEKLNQEKTEFFKTKHKAKDVEEFNKKYDELLNNKKALVEHLKEATQGKKFDIIFGIRPEDIVSVNKTGPETLHTEIKLSELLGDQYYVHFDFGGQDVLSKVLTDATLKTDDPIDLEFKKEKIHLFDSLTEKTIL